MSRLDHTLEPSPVRRIEVITGSEKRRRWTDDEKARVIEETLQPDAIVSEIAQRHGLTPQQVFTWRREARRRAEADGAASFVPAVIDAREIAPASVDATRPMIELDIGGNSMWIWPDADESLVTAVIHALKKNRSGRA
ncbi:MAG: transposase [Rhodoblastus sp.]|nr:transposase [Rhodoblastus sp.]